jgi:hypothetical protein
MPDGSAAQGIIFWDMAGTLLSRSRITGELCALPGSPAVLDRLRQDWTLLLTTSDFTESARSLLRSLDLIQYFQEIHGGIATPGGKPYGALAAAHGVPAERCLAVGDDVYFDLPADTESIVTILINQRSFTLHAETIEWLVRLLTENGALPCDRFVKMMADAQTTSPASPQLRHLTVQGLEMQLGWLPRFGGTGRLPVVVLPG